MCSIRTLFSVQGKEEYRKSVYVFYKFIGKIGIIK